MYFDMKTSVVLQVIQWKPGILAVILIKSVTQKC